MNYPFPHRFVPANYRNFYLAQGMSETDVVRDIVALLQSYRVDATVIDAGGRRARGRLIAAAKTAGIEIGTLPHLKTGAGIPKGFADIEATLAPEGRSLYIEVKQPRRVNPCGKVERREGEPTPEQLEFLREKHARGALVMVAWSAEDVEQFLQVELRRNRRALQNGKTEIRGNLAGTR